ncbi:MAG TPA: DUF2087 domain-containing protein [Actinomycetes bacterium]|nr:DUF2087 domain-containing protein [Actinomycetes bacterium]
MARTVDRSLLLSRFLDADGRLLTMPRRRSDRLVVLEHVAQSIEPDTDLDESAVNARLRPIHDDVAMLRRYLVDEGLLQRRPPGVYRRAS